MIKAACCFVNSSDLHLTACLSLGTKQTEGDVPLYQVGTYLQLGKVIRSSPGQIKREGPLWNVTVVVVFVSLAAVTARHSSRKPWVRGG